MEYILWKFIESFFFEFRYKKEARRNFSYLLLQLTQLKICTKYYMGVTCKVT